MVTSTSVPPSAPRRLGLVAAVVIAASLSGCAVNEEPATSGEGLQGAIVGAGSSAQAIAQEVWIADFQTQNPGVRIDYDAVGSGAGREQFIDGATDFAASDAALSDDDLERDFASCAPGSKAIDLPVYVSPLVLIFNLEGVPELGLDAATIAGIFSGRITAWNDPALVALNPGVALPELPIAAVHRSDPSGTTKNFADYLHQNVPDVWADEPADEFPYPGEAAQGNSGIVNAVISGNGTIGYVDASRAGDIPVASLAVGDSFVDYSAEAASAILDVSPLAERPNPFDLVVEVDRTSTAEGVYPLVLVSYIIACEEYEDPALSELVRQYIASTISEEGQQAAAEVAGSAPLSAEFAARIAEAAASIR